MKREDLEVGQVWMRKDGRTVRLDEERMFRGSREFMLVTVDGKGRKTWKWDGGIINELTYCGN